MCKCFLDEFFAIYAWDNCEYEIISMGELKIKQKAPTSIIKQINRRYFVNLPTKIKSQQNYCFTICPNRIVTIKMASQKF